MLLDNKVNALLGALLCVATFGAHSADNNLPRHLVFTSDPQYPWTESSDHGWDETTAEKEQRSKWLIETQYSDVASFRRNHSVDPAHIPVMVNGDMTAFGHGYQRDMIRSILDKQLGGVYDYGLGNHDYENNVDDCFLNNCAAGSIVDFKNRYLGKLAALDMRVSDEGAVKKGIFGSLAYSKDFGDVHIVQLHNEPTYTAGFTAWDWGVPTGYQISESLDWLEEDLKRARESAKIILLNMHKPDRWKGSTEQIARFKAIIERYKVTAVFAGHLHTEPGSYYGWNKRDYFGDVPVFLSGGASNQTYLIADMSTDRKTLKVFQVNQNNWPSRKEIQTVEVR
ncbi:metallophosphoesterase family protein [Pseudomonas lini]|uniref:Phosphoesterase n=1 Tax=Pseudomonas lini TaxID=163011 RepID=A0A0J6KBX2_9PSED|nr:metallophosphoesterase [Pseudomonas lini]KAB0498343.1 phosphoesterase [Pseudomonas lini]KMM93542.1 phosphoesterase [Pseudomonas lini]SDT56483.1 Calcineurin-like phosphoesterase [Pseudomonas lini]